MTISEIRNRVCFHFLLGAVITAAGAIALLLGGCQKVEEGGNDALAGVTYDNVQTAYARESKMITMYSLFVDQARKERNTGAEALFTALKRSEEIHARNHIQLLLNAGRQAETPATEKIVVGTIPQTLKMALSSEEIEYGGMYPSLRIAAARERMGTAAEQFLLTERSDIRHAELLLDAINTNGKLKRAEYVLCPACGFVTTAGSVQICPVCQMSAASFEKVL